MNSERKVVLTTLIVLFILVILLFVFKNNIKAYQKGIDVRYLDDPNYCEINSDCIFEEYSCSYVNKFNYRVASAESCFASSTSRCLENTCIGDYYSKEN